MKFRYKARTETGELQVGIVTAASREAALNILEGHGLYVLSLEKIRIKKGLIQRILEFLKKVNRKDLMIYSRQLATLLSSKISLSRSLKILYGQVSNPYLKEATAALISDIEAGLSFSQALEKHPSIFSSFFVNMVRSGEVTGRIDEAVEYMASYYEKEVVLTSKIRGALIYPVIVIVLFIGVVLLMVTQVFPQIEPIFAEAKVELPLFTKALIYIGKFGIKWWWLVTSVIALVIFLVIDYIRTPEGRIVFDEISLRLPGIGALLRKLSIVRFTAACAVLIKGGIPMAQAIEISAITIGNIVYRDLLREAVKGIREGKALSQVLTKAPSYFPPLVSQLISVGESTGQVTSMLNRISDFYSREVDDAVTNLVELIQPVLIVAIGVMVGFLFASILMPIYNLALKF